MILPTDPKSSFETADWVEYMVTSTNTPMSKSELFAYIEAASGSEPAENDINDIMLELGKREKYYGDEAPFTVEKEIVTPKFKWEENPEYMTCLILDLEGVQGTTTLTGKLFERIANEAIRKYLDCESIIFGYPSELTIAEIAQKVNGKFNSELPPGSKDRKVDIIAWKEFKDKRNNQITILFQCAAGANWRTKTTELPIRPWCRYIFWGDVPHRGFSVPIIIPDEDLLEISEEAGIIVDRIRIYKYIREAAPNTSLRSELLEWCKTRLANTSN